MRQNHTQEAKNFKNFSILFVASSSPSPNPEKFLKLDMEKG